MDGSGSSAVIDAPLPCDRYSCAASKPGFCLIDMIFTRHLIHFRAAVWYGDQAGRERELWVIENGNRCNPRSRPRVRTKRRTNFRTVSACGIPKSTRHCGRLDERTWPANSPPWNPGASRVLRCRVWRRHDGHAQAQHGLPFRRSAGNRADTARWDPAHRRSAPNHQRNIP